MRSPHLIESVESFLDSIDEVEELFLAHILLFDFYLFDNLSEAFRHELIIHFDFDLIDGRDDLEFMQFDDMFRFDFSSSFEFGIYFLG